MGEYHALNHRAQLTTRKVTQRTPEAGNLQLENSYANGNNDARRRIPRTNQDLPRQIKRATSRAKSKTQHPQNDSPDNQQSKMRLTPKLHKKNDTTDHKNTPPEQARKKLQNYDAVLYADNANFLLPEEGKKHHRLNGKLLQNNQNETTRNTTRKSITTNKTDKNTCRKRIARISQQNNKSQGRNSTRKTSRHVWQKNKRNPTSTAKSRTNMARRKGDILKYIHTPETPHTTLECNNKVDARK